MFETDRIDQKWVEECNNASEVWVPSYFNMASFITSGVDPQKIKVIGESIDTDVYSPDIIKPLNLLDHIKTFQDDTFVLPNRPKPFVFLR